MMDSLSALKVTRLSAIWSSRQPSAPRRSAKPVNTEWVRPLSRCNIARAAARSAGLFNTWLSMQTVVSAPSTNASG